MQSVTQATQAAPADVKPQVVSLQQLESQKEAIGDQLTSTFETVLTELSPVPDASEKIDTAQRYQDGRKKRT